MVIGFGQCKRGGLKRDHEGFGLMIEPSCILKDSMASGYILGITNKIESAGRNFTVCELTTKR